MIISTEEAQELIIFYNIWCDGVIGVDHLNSGIRRGQVRSVVDITAWRLGNLQAKWCVRPVNGVRVHLNIMGNVVEEI